MKKLLVFGAAMLVSASSAFAIEEVYIDEYLTAISPNGYWAAGATDDGSIVIRNLQTNEVFRSNTNGINRFYYVGSGSTPLSNTGVMVGSITGNEASYWENGKWTTLKTPNPQYMSNACSITPDAKVICGGAGQDEFGLDSKNIMLTPAVWYRQPDGTYSDPVMLPHPDKDFTGRTPQYITAVSISQDGKTVAGQIRDYTGFIQEPILYTCDDEGNWSYTLLYPELVNPSGEAFPPYPGEFDLPQPMQEQYMTEEEFNEYRKALDEYYADKSGQKEEPTYEEFMTESEYAEYIEAFLEWYAVYQPWEKAYDEFMEVYIEALEDGWAFEFNNVHLTLDGKYYATVRKQTIIEDPLDGPMDVYVPVVLAVDGSEAKQLNGNTGDSMYTTGITSDYSVLATKFDPHGLEPKRAYIYPEMATTGEPLEDFIAGIDPKVAEWMEAQMWRESAYALDSHNQPLYKEFMCSGSPISTPDMSRFICFMTSDYWLEPDGYYYSYVFDSGLVPSTGVENVVAPANGLKLDANGVIALDGDFRAIDIFNVAGAKVYSASNISGSINPNLSDGIYIIKAVAADGAESTLKVRF